MIGRSKRASAAATLVRKDRAHLPRDLEVFAGADDQRPDGGAASTL
jgi:hypothetical protein